MTNSVDSPPASTTMEFPRASVSFPVISPVSVLLPQALITSTSIVIKTVKINGFIILIACVLPVSFICFSANNSFLILLFFSFLVSMFGV